MFGKCLSEINYKSVYLNSSDKYNYFYGENSKNDNTSSIVSSNYYDHYRGVVSKTERPVYDIALISYLGIAYNIDNAFYNTDFNENFLIFFTEYFLVFVSDDSEMKIFIAWGDINKYNITDGTLSLYHKNMFIVVKDKTIVDMLNAILNAFSHERSNETIHYVNNDKYYLSDKLIPYHVNVEKEKIKASDSILLVKGYYSVSGAILAILKDEGEIATQVFASGQYGGERAMYTKNHGRDGQNANYILHGEKGLVFYDHLHDYSSFYDWSEIDEIFIGNGIISGNFKMLISFHKKVEPFIYVSKGNAEYLVKLFKNKNYPIKPFPKKYQDGNNILY